MRRIFLSTTGAVLAMTLMSAPMAMAQPAPNPYSPNGHAKAANQPMPHQATPPGHTQAPQHPGMSQMSGHGEASNMAMPHQATPPQHMASSGHAWHHGDRYDGNRRVVSNWQHDHLRQPHAGYEWVQDGNQFVLIAVASGLIAEVIATR